MTNYYVVRTREAVDSYVQKGVSAIGWSEVDFTKYSTVESLCDAVRNKYYANNVSSRLCGRKLGEIKKFKSIRAGDIIIVPCYKGFYIGKATGEFLYDKSEESYNNDLSNQIVLEYVNNGKSPVRFSRDGKLTALASKLCVRGFTVLCITEDEIKKEIDDLLNSRQDFSYQEKVIAKESLQANRFREELKSVLPNYRKIALASGGRGFEKLIEALMKIDGFETRILPKTIGGCSEADADVLAVRRSGLGDEFTTAYYIQAKHYWGTSDNGIAQIVQFKNEQEAYEDKQSALFIEKYQLDSNQIKYVLISSGEFTESVKDLADENDIILIDGNRFAEILFEVIDDLPDEIRYQLGFIKKYEHV